MTLAKVIWFHVFFCLAVAINYLILGDIRTSTVVCLVAFPVFYVLHWAIGKIADSQEAEHGRMGDGR